MVAVLQAWVGPPAPCTRDDSFALVAWDLKWPSQLGPLELSMAFPLESCHNGCIISGVRVR